MVVKVFITPVFVSLSDLSYCNFRKHTWIDQNSKAVLWIVIAYFLMNNMCVVFMFFYRDTKHIIKYADYDGFICFLMILVWCEQSETGICFVYNRIYWTENAMYSIYSFSFTGMQVEFEYITV